MKHEVFVLGGQRIDQKSKKGWKLGEMRKARRERMRKGAIVSSSTQSMTSWSSSIKIWFFSSLYNALLKCHGVKQNANICANGEQNVIIEVFILEELIRRERRDGGEGEERGLRKGEREDRDRKKRDKREWS